MSAPALSIIVPVYDVEDYLSLCLDSIVNQSFEDYELILVDDGSTDHSGKICDEYAQKDKRIVVLHKENGGLSSARNKGLDIASGRYITFVDSDDRIAPDTYAENMEILMQHPDIDILQFPTHWGKENTDVHTLLKQQFFSGEKEIFSNWWEGSVLNASVWNKIFHGEIFSEIRFPEGYFFEDIFLIVDFSEIAKKVMISEKGCYFYLIREDSISNAPHYTLKKNLDLFLAHFKVYKKLYSFDHLKSYRVIGFSRVYRRLIEARRSDEKADLKQFINQLKEYVPEWRDIFNSKSGLHETIWFLVVKVLGLALFMTLFIKYINLKENNLKQKH